MRYRNTLWILVAALALVGLILGCNGGGGGGGTSVAASARCADGTLSYSQNCSGTCSSHGGVAEWYRSGCGSTNPGGGSGGTGTGGNNGTSGGTGGNTNPSPLPPIETEFFATWTGTWTNDNRATTGTTERGTITLTFRPDGGVAGSLFNMTTRQPADNLQGVFQRQPVDGVLYRRGDRVLTLPFTYTGTSEVRILEAVIGFPSGGHVTGSLTMRVNGRAVGYGFLDLTRTAS